ncbi:hypothetical protein E2C01_022269 [Portunus trituberculatus]|uniref:Uncharacterized protein n=1 Tax=Portunus trituberculatus TaxID=210409 RepID=A0A5B7E4X3_PORTR|nr:hypothetical protein [Portunus trituberculatus]
MLPTLRSRVIATQKCPQHAWACLHHAGGEHVDAAEGGTGVRPSPGSCLAVTHAPAGRSGLRLESSVQLRERRLPGRCFHLLFPLFPLPRPPLVSLYLSQPPAMGVEALAAAESVIADSRTREERNLPGQGTYWWSLLSEHPDIQNSAVDEEEKKWICRCNRSG